VVALLIALGVLIFGVSAVLLVRALVLPRLRLESHLQDVDSYGFAAPGAAEAELGASARGSFNEAFNRFAERVGRALLRYVPRIQAVRRGELTAAGFYELSREALHGYRALAAAFFPALVLLYALRSGGLSPLVVVLTVLIGALGWQLPATLVGWRARSRLNQIDRDLPQFIDLLVATIEAGSAFGSALDGVARRIHGPLGAELQLTRRQERLGIGTERALNDMVERCDAPSVRAFVRVVIRAESHGASIGPVLRHLASDIRQRRRDAAREKIQKAPIKLLFPLAFLIMPALMLAILFPAMYNIVQTLAGHQ
jgi:tight adherence protein C